MSSRDPEIRQLSVATAQAYAIAERLAFELDETLGDLSRHLHQVHAADEETEDDDERR